MNNGKLDEAVNRTLDTAKIHAAKVVVLTAEVKALMVGSRQVTRSVFRQLDEVAYEDCKPMGRINEPGGRWLVGSDENGILVRARFDRERPTFTWDEQEELQGLYNQAKYGPSPFSNEKRGRIAELEAIKARIPEWQHKWAAARDKYEALPLIVLAGLR